MEIHVSLLDEAAMKAMMKMTVNKTQPKQKNLPAMALYPHCIGADKKIEFMKTIDYNLYWYNNVEPKFVIFLIWNL